MVNLKKHLSGNSMKAFIITLTLFSISFYAFAKGDDGGWSSSGGGEYIINQNNPWFMGNETVKWCIDHGGEDKFSLPFNLAKIEVAKGIAILVDQLKIVNTHSSVAHYSSLKNGQFLRTCSSKNCDGFWDIGDGEFMSDNFTFTPDCSKADLEVILGNYNNEKIKNFIAEIGVEKFQRIAGVAMRTEYSEDTFKGKGFIYIAADKGEIQYAGARNIVFQSKTIWDTHKKLNENAPVPDVVKTDANTINAILKNLKFKEFTIGVLAPIIAHEFSHVLGFKHTSFQNIMNEDYPAEIIKTGLVFKGNFLRESMILSRGLIESDMARRIGFEWNTNRLKRQVKNDMQKDHPLLNKLLLETPPEFQEDDGPGIPIFFIFDLGPDIGGGNWKLNVATYEKNSLKYKIFKTYETEETLPCTSSVEVQSVDLRSSTTLDGTTGITYDETSNKWISTNNDTSGSVTNNVKLLRMDNHYKCGKIFINKLKTNKYISYRITHNYFNDTSTIQLSENDNGTPLTLWLRDSDIFGEADSPLPIPLPVFKFE